MSKSSLVQQIVKPIGKKEAASLATHRERSTCELLSLSLSSNYEVAFRAAWILEIFVEEYPDCFSVHLEDFIVTYLKLKNQSCQRHFTKILMSLTRTTSKLEKLPANFFEDIVETTFEWMINPQTPVAVRVNCMDILYNLNSKYEWIADELGAQIEFQLKTGSAALQSRGKKILSKLHSR